MSWTRAFAAGAVTVVGVYAGYQHSRYMNAVIKQREAQTKTLNAVFDDIALPIAVAVKESDQLKVSARISKPISTNTNAFLG